MSNLIHNEKVKLQARVFGNIGVAAIVGGFVAPLFERSGLNTTLSIAFVIVAGLAVGGIAITAGMWALTSLKE